MRDDQRSNYRAWPFQEAAQIVKQRRPTGDRPLLFETGFGPSGLPHIGTFAEVASGAHHSCAITSNGQLQCWGNNNTHQLSHP